MKKKILVCITARPSYSRIRTAILSLKDNPKVEVQVLASGSALLDRYGRVVDLIRKDGIEVIEELYTFVEGRPIQDTNKEQLVSLGKSVARLHQSGESSELFRKNMMLIPSWRYITESFSENNPKINSLEYKYILENINNLQDKFPINLRQINIHADLFKDNIFFLGNQVSGFIDFFFSCTDTVIYDLATFANAWFFQGNKFVEDNYLIFIKSYLQNFKLTNEEKDSFNFYLKVSAIRFFLTRLYDLHFNKEGNVKHKNPIEFFEIFKFHEKNNIQDLF